MFLHRLGFTRASGPPVPSRLAALRQTNRPEYFVGEALGVLAALRPTNRLDTSVFVSELLGATSAINGGSKNPAVKI